MDLTGVRNPALIQLQLQRRLVKQLQEQFGPNEPMAKLRLLGKGKVITNQDYKNKLEMALLSNMTKPGESKDEYIERIMSGFRV